MKIALALIASFSLMAALTLPERHGAEPEGQVGSVDDGPHSAVIARLGIGESADFVGRNASECSGSGNRGTRSAPKATPQGRLTATYRAMRARWHRPPTASEREAWRKNGAPLVIRPIHSSEEFVIERDPETRAYDEAAHQTAMLAFQWKSDGTMHPIEERLLHLIHDAAAHFKAPYVHLISGVRNRPGRGTSRHNQGRAADIVLPGISDARLAAYMRRQGYVGVGLYPVSGFTHVDVRDRSYYWVDRSGPGQRSRSRSIMQSAVAQNDARARRRGVEPTPPYDLAMRDSLIVVAKSPEDASRADETRRGEESEDRPILASAERAPLQEE